MCVCVCVNEPLSSRVFQHAFFLPLLTVTLWCTVASMVPLSVSSEAWGQRQCGVVQARPVPVVLRGGIALSVMGM